MTDIYTAPPTTTETLAVAGGGDGITAILIAANTELALKSTLASPTFTGTVTVPTPFTIGAVSMTATGTELNVLDGIPATLTATELGYVDGVTSAIQTQMNLKAPLASPTFTGTVTLPVALSGIAKLTSGVVSAVTAPSGAIVGTTDTQTLTNKRHTKRTGTTTSHATPTINTDNVDFYSITAQTEAITSMTTNLSGTPTEAQTLWIAITGTAARAITWGTSFEASTIDLPTTTVTTARLDVGFVWNTVTSKWRCVGSA